MSLASPMGGDVKRKTLPFSLQGGGRLSDMHPAQRCGLDAYFLSLTRAVAGYIPSVSLSDAGSTPSAREATQAEVLARGNVPTMILCGPRGPRLYWVMRGRIG